MKIAVNARFFSHPFTGISQYTKNLLIHLANLDKNIRYYLVLNKALKPEIKSLFPENVMFKHIKEKSLILSGAKKTWWEQIQLPEYFSKEGIDIAFFPYPSNPWTKDWYESDIKTVLTVHDCIPWIDKNYNSGILSKMYHKQSRKAVKMADIILTVSNESKKDIINVCKVKEEKIHVIYNDISGIYKEKINQNVIDKVLKYFNLNKNKYFLYVGGYDQRKNIKQLIEEFNLIESDYKLVLAGGKILNKKLYSDFDKTEHKNIIKTGFIDEKSLAALYKGAAAFINLSKLEGFNLPILEAANCETPLILSDIPVHREVAKNAAMFVDLTNSGSVAKHIKYIIENKENDKLRQASLELAKHYSWEGHAQKVYTIFKNLV